jgi:adenine phosphoribosyltransferase
MSAVQTTERALKTAIRTVHDWPKAGIAFRDITPVLAQPEVFRLVIDALTERYASQAISAIAAIDARGFIIGAPLAYALGASLVPVRKSGKLPHETWREDYELEYGTASVEIHRDALHTGQRVVLVDDLVATGGTMLAAARLIARLQANLVEATALVDLPALGGSQRLRDLGIPVYAMCTYGD